MVDKIFEVIEDIAQQGVTILLIEQNARLALEVSQRGYVLESGELTLARPSPRLLARPQGARGVFGGGGGVEHALTTPPAPFRAVELQKT